MKNVLFLGLALLYISALTAQTSIKGKVVDASNNEALIGATVQVLESYRATSTNSEGQFELRNISESANLRVSYIGYEADTINRAELSETMTIRLEQKSYQTDEVIITSTRVSKNAPATATNVTKEEIGKNNLGQDIPYLLQQTPSAVSTSDAGAGIGYTGIRIRGSDASRINVTVNGIPLNDAESHGVFWVNMPDLASSLESVQIQRGIGTSTNGAGAFGATLNMETTGIEEDAYAEINNSFGSFNSRKHTVKVGSGLINDKFQFEGRLSQINSDGYIDRASSNLQSYYLSGAYYGKKTIIKAITFGGHERTYQAWYGTPESRLTGNVDSMKTHASNEGYSDQRTENLLNAGRTYNYYLYSNQVDNYNQDHYQLHLSHEFSKKVTANFALHYTKGEGYFEEYKAGEDLADYNLNSLIIGNDTISSTDLIRRRWLDNDFYGFTYSVLYKPSKKLSFNLGGGLNNYEGDHFGRIIWAQFASNSFPTDEYYDNVGEKLDGNSYLKTNYQVNNNLALFADLQVRSIQYSVKGIDNDQRLLDVEEDFLFFNPKIGANYKLSDKMQAYVFAGIGNREPNRADFIDQNPNTPPSEANEAETMRNIETGIDYRANKYQIAANFYLMDYDNQLVNTGQLNDVGSPIRQNVDRSYRAGIELQAAVKATDKLTLSVNATYSQNKIQNFTYTLYDYTNGFDVIEQELGTTDIALSPEVIANGEVKYQLFENLEVALLSRYVGEQYLDNTSNENRKIDAYLVNDFRLNYKIPTKLIKNASLKLLVNNVFSEKYSANGYTYSYIFGSTITENFYYPQAFRNYLVSLDLKF
ncbi:MAG: TonB-dependent receptor [Vicingaceae bacterium]